MLFSTSCKQGRLQLMEDGALSVVSLFGGQVVWSDHARAVRAFDVKPGAMGSCGFIIHATQDHLVTMVVQKDFAQLCQFFQVPVNQVAELRIIEAVPDQPAAPAYRQPMPQQQVMVQPSFPAMPPQAMPQPSYPLTPQPQPYYQPGPPAYQQPPYQPALTPVPPAAPAAPEMETTVKAYENAGAFQRDQKKMQKAGWTIQSTMDHHQARSVAYKLIVPFGMLSSGKNQIIVTYQRQKKR